MLQVLVALLLLPFLLLLGGVSAIVVWESLVIGWHSGAVPTALGCVVLAFVLLAWPRRRVRKSADAS
jgi:hypothetical protein